jgi:hypothetical protein
MFWDITKPVNSGWLEWDLWVESTRHGVVYINLPLFLQQPDQLSLRVYVAPDAPVGVVKETNDGGLLRQFWSKDLKI